jgi:polysaccharide export outer membrane protein
VTVLPDGTVNLPLVGRVHFAGESTDQASRLLTRDLSQFIRKPLATVEIATQGQIDVLVLGDVKTPGKYPLRANAKLSDAIAASGGLDTTIVGDLPPARVENGDAPIQTVSLQALLRNGDTSQDLPLSDNAVVYVQSRVSYAIEVVGAVDHPGDMEMHQGDRLSVAIAKAGNSAAAQSDLSHVFVTSTSASGEHVTREIDMYQILEHGDIAADPELQKGDVVFIPEARKPNQTPFSLLSIARLFFGI